MTDAISTQAPTDPLAADPYRTPAVKPWQPGDFWAAAPRDVLATLMTDRIDGYYKALVDSGRRDSYDRALSAYYGEDPDDGTRADRVHFAGEEGEIVKHKINEFASTLNLAHTLITGTRPAAKPQAANSTYGATEDTILADLILEHDLHHAGLEDALKHVARLAMLLGEGWLYQGWDVMRGKQFDADPQTGRRFYEGDIVTEPLSPIDVIRDPHHAVSPTHQHPWLIVRRPVNRFALLAQFAGDEEMEAEIRAMPSVADEKGERTLRWGSAENSLTDQVYQYELYYPGAPELPDGRFALLIGTKCPIALPFAGTTPPVHPMYAAHQQGSAFGFSFFWMLLGPQTLLDAAISTISTNHDAFGVQTIHAPPSEGEELDVQIVEGLRVVRTRLPPAPIQLLSIAKESFDYFELMRNAIERLSNVSGVLRGDPEKQLKSGASLAYVGAMSMQAMSGEQGGYARCLERAYTGRLEVYRLHVKAPRLLAIAGEDLSSTVREWTGQQLDGVRRVIVQIANPAMNTLTMRAELADKYVANGWITTPEQYTQMIVTGRIEPVLKRDRDEMRLIQRENEALARGEGVIEGVELDEATGMEMPGLVDDPATAVPVLKYHRHLLHIPEHACRLSSPEAYDNPKMVKALEIHLRKHEMERARMVVQEPWLLEALGEPLTPSEQMQAQQMMAPPPPPGPMDAAALPAGPPGEGGGGAPSPETEGRAAPLGTDGSMPGPAQAEMPLMPLMPDGSGRAQVPGGGVQ